MPVTLGKTHMENLVILVVLDLPKRWTSPSTDGRAALMSCCLPCTPEPFTFKMSPVQGTWPTYHLEELTLQTLCTLVGSLICVLVHFGWV